MSSWGAQTEPAMHGAPLPDDDPTRLGGAPPQAATEPLPCAPSHNALAPGTRLLEFEIVAVIGEGGFGIVYRAYDHALQREVALKEYLPASLAHRVGPLEVAVSSTRTADTFVAGLRSFVNEARLLAQFDHPSLVKVHRFWEANGTGYMVMPYYRGETLKAALRRSAVPVTEAWLRSLLANLLDALEVLHSHQCLHRDVAPDNILLLPDGRPVLLDFGAARRVIADSDRTLTVIYKPNYAPIEQHGEASSAKQGPWTDMYALSAVAHFAITGSPPPSALGRLLSDTYVPLARAAAGRFSPQLLAGLDRGLAFKPEQRPQSVAEMRAALGLDHAVVDYTRPQATPTGAKLPSETPSRPTPSFVPFAVVGGLIVLAGVAALWSLWYRPTPESSGEPVRATIAPVKPAPATTLPPATSGAPIRESTRERETASSSGPDAAVDKASTVDRSQSPTATQAAPGRLPSGMPREPFATRTPTGVEPGVSSSPARREARESAAAHNPVPPAARTDRSTAATTPRERAPTSGRPQSERCASLLMRAQLGEPMTAADMSYLQKECR